MKRKYRLLSMICSVVLLVGLLPTAAFAANPCDDGCFVVDGITYLPISGTTDEVEVVSPGFHPVEGATVSTYTGTVSIPATVTHDEATYNVTRIGNDAFSRDTQDPQVTSVTIAEGVKEIGETAFQGCSGLTTLSLPSSITTIGFGAFGKCTGLKSLEIPAGVTNGLVQALTGGVYGGSETFYPYNFLYDETSGEGIKFAQGSSYEFVTVTDGTNTANLLYNGTILDGVLRTYTASTSEITGDELTSLTIREGTTEIGPSAMAALTQLETVTMPTGRTLKTIGYDAFDGCAALTSIDLSSVETIGAMAFYGTALTSVDLSSLKTFETITDGDDEYSMAFSNCESLTTVLFGAVEEVPADTFASYGGDPAALTFVMLGTTPPTLDDEFYIENLTVIIPAGSEEAYKNSALGSYIQTDDSETKPGITYGLTLENTTLTEGNTYTPTITVPTGASVEVSSNDTNVATANYDNGVLTVTGIKAGSATITASIKLNGIALVSATCTVTVTSYTPPVVPTYTITTPDVDNGTITVSPKAATGGRTVTITVTPDEGYELDTLTVTDAKGNEIALTDLGGGKYSFKMPYSKVTVDATFVETEPEPVVDPVKDCPKDETCPAAKFEDVKLGEWYHDGIHYCVVEDLMNGTGTSTFEPDSTTERAMLVTVLYRLEGEPTVGKCNFTDVRANEWYTDAITWAAENKIVEGYGDGTFGPEDAITREQMATILYRYAKYKGYDVTAKTDITTFVDGSDTEDWAEDAMAWAVAEKLINGIENNQLDPQGDATRAQMATILYRFCENVAK